MRKEFIINRGNYKTHVMEYRNNKERKQVEALHLVSLVGQEICCRECDKVTPLEQLGTLEDEDYGICDKCSKRK